MHYTCNSICTSKFLKWTNGLTTVWKLLNTMSRVFQGHNTESIGCTHRLMYEKVCKYCSNK